MSVLLEALGNITTLTMILLFISLAIALFYEMVNGFHDTANAVAMIIYTNSMKAGYSVIMAGIMNFLGVILGGIGVAYVIVHLLPLDIMVSTDQTATLVMIFSLFLARIRGTIKIQWTRYDFLMALYFISLILVTVFTTGIT